MTEQSALTDEKAIELAKNAHSQSETYFDSSVRARMEADIRQVQGVHPNSSKYHTEQYRTRSKLFRPKTRTSLRKAEAACTSAYFSTDDIVNIAPEDETNDMQHASAAIMRELVDHRLTKDARWFKTVVGAFQEARTVGLVASLQTWVMDNDTDRPDVKLIPPENVRIAPSSDWIDPVNESPYVILKLPMYVYEIKDRQKSEVNKWRSVGEAELKTASQTGDSIRNQRENDQADSKEQNSSIHDYSIVWVSLNFMRFGGDDYCYYTINESVLLSTPRKVGKAFPHVNGTGQRPVVLGQAVIQAHKTYVDSHPTMTRDIQNEINTTANMRQDNVKIAMEKRWLVRRGKQTDVRSLLYGGSNSITFTNDPERDIKEISTNDVTRSAYEEQDRLNLDYDDLAGAFSGSSVQSNRKLNETVGGMNLISAQANQMEEYDLRVFNETWMEPVLRQVVWMEQSYETDTVVLALAGKKAKLHQKFGIDTITDDLLAQSLTLKVNAGTGSTNTVNQLERLIYAVSNIKEMFGEVGSMRLKEDELIKEIFGKVGYKDGGRFFTPAGDNPEVDGLIEQIQMLQSAIAEKNPPELIQAKIEEIKARAENQNATKVKLLVESFFSAMQAAGTIAENPMIAPVGDKVMQASGYSEPTPAGIDPNIPVVSEETTQQNPVELLPEVDENTSPMHPPVPDSPTEGVQAGIETAELTD